LPFSRTGSPNEIYATNGMHNSMKQTTDEGIFGFSGIEVMNHTFFGAVPVVDEDTRKQYLKEVSDIIKKSLER